MTQWPAEKARETFSSMLEACLQSGPQFVTVEGVDTAVLVPIGQWHRAHSPGRSLKELLLTDEARGDLRIPPRHRTR
jgi:hypothetical protein